ncbi:hypothetical protein TSUD_65920 [Trifolium subterraneum]|uniref:Uncharacterized protein n=1 Tax=Trifolium subterraneum TaxID=3900 RepID=A0A2Z6MWE4_TRISU|nr:hypothetical protein TSUD_65920 [Trifolium subterraneum]
MDEEGEKVGLVRRPGFLEKGKKRETLENHGRLELGIENGSRLCQCCADVAVELNGHRNGVQAHRVYVTE